MNYREKIGLWIIASLLLAGMVTWENGNGDEFQHLALTEWLDHLYENDRFMGSVAMRHSDEVIYEYQAGQAGFHEEIDIGPDTQFRIGSITKMFTAVILLQLTDEGHLSLDNRLADYFGELPNAEKITLEHMLRHRSGLFNFTSAEGFTEWILQPRSRSELLDRISVDSPVFQPGERAQYSNANFLLLGYIVEDITGKPYAEVLRERIIEPLELKRTNYGGTISVRKNEARSYRFSEIEQQWNPAPETDVSGIHAAGGIISTPTDLTKFARALFTGELIGQNKLDRMTEFRDGYGLGLLEFSFEDEELYGYGHIGGIDSFHSNLTYLPEENISLSITANALRFSDRQIRNTMLEAWRGERPELPELQTVELTENHLQRLIGDYKSDELSLEISIGVEDGRLTAKAAHQPAFLLTASGKHRFHLLEADAVIEFPEPENGSYDQFILHQDGGKFAFFRK